MPKIANSKKICSDQQVRLLLCFGNLNLVSSGYFLGEMLYVGSTEMRAQDTLERLSLRQPGNVFVPPDEQEEEAGEREVCADCCPNAPTLHTCCKTHIMK